MKKTTEDFSIGQTVNVRHIEGDLFNHNFTGTVIGFHNGYVTVSDQDGDAWDCEPEQLSPNSDDIVHGI